MIEVNQYGDIKPMWCRCLETKFRIIGRLRHWETRVYCNAEWMKKQVWFVAWEICVILMSAVGLINLDRTVESDIFDSAAYGV